MAPQALPTRRIRRSDVPPLGQRDPAYIGDNMTDRAGWYNIGNTTITT
ncbi:hypothetical protein [Lentzea flava]|nr:hypothetical protein [Lentzea flava]